MTGRVPAVLRGLAGLLALYIALPFLAGLLQLGRADWAGADPAALARASAVSIGSATVAAALVAVGGIPLGYLLAHRPGRAASLLGFLVQLPLALPPLASGVLLLFLFGAYAPATRLLGQITDTFWGIVAAQSFVAAPFLIIAARSAFAAIDPLLEDVAATLGHAAYARFLRVSLRLAWPAVRAGLLLAWLRGFGEFGATVLVAYHPYSLPVYTYVAFGAAGLPAMLPVLLPTLAVAVGVMALSVLLVRRNGAGTIAAPDVLASDSDLIETAAVGNGHVARPDPVAPLAFRLHKRLGDFDLNVAWTPRGRRLAILGPSGSGKSLTLRLLAGLDAPETGFVRVGARDLSALPPQARGVGYVPQGFALLPDRTVLEQLLFPVGASAAEAARWIGRFGLSGLEDRLPEQLSLGQQQRVALARALLRPAALLLLDEPFSALDAPLRARLREQLRSLQRQIDATTILVTHDPEEAMLLADEILLVDHGRVLQAGAVAEVAARPASGQAAALLGLDLHRGVAAGADHIAVGEGVCLAVTAPPLRPGGPVLWTVRRELVRLCASGGCAASVEEVRPVGGGSEVIVRLGSARLRTLTAPGEVPALGPCRIAIGAGAVQAWPDPAQPG